MIRLLSNSVIDGIALDKRIYNYFKIRLSDKSSTLYNATLENIFYNHTVVTDIKSKKSGTLSFGMLVRRHGDNEFFRRYITDNRMQVSACDTLRMNSFASAQVNVCSP